MTPPRRLPRSLATASAAVFAAFAAACGDAPPPPVTGPVAGAPIAGAPIAGAPTSAPVERPSEPAAPARAATEPPIVAAEPPAKPAASAPDTAIGDPTTREERSPEDVAVTTPAPKDPAGDAPGGAAFSRDRPSPIPPTTASQSAKPSLPDRAKPAAAAAARTEAAVDPKTGLKSFIPKDHKKEEPLVLGFEELASFDYTPPPPPSSDDDAPAPDPKIAVEAARKQIPPEIWELEGKVLTVEGYMIPLEYQDDGVKSFLISRHAMGCCFGVMPRPHELVECTLAEGKTTPYVGYIPVTVTGVFHVTPPTGPQTMLTGIYKMDAPTVAIPRER